MKRFSTILSLLLAVLLVFTSCAALAEAPVEKHVVYLTTITPDQASYQMIEALVKAYQEEVNPGFTMEMQYIADKPSYLQKVKTLAASGELPDMFNVDADPYANVLLENGLLQDLTGLVSENKLDEIFYAAPLAWGRSSTGVQIAIPINYSMEVFWYNKAMFAEAGVEIPKTFDDFLAACAKLKGAGFTPHLRGR